MDFFRKFLSDVDLVEGLKVVPRKVGDSELTRGDAGFQRDVRVTDGMTDAEMPHRNSSSSAGLANRQDTVDSETDIEITLDSSFPHAYELSYTCIMVPRFQSHHLLGDVVKSIDHWVRETSISYGWRLEFLLIKPEYLELGISVSPAIAPTDFVHLLCAQTSRLIFDDYPRFLKKNPSKKFWADVFFAASGLKPVSAYIIDEFIRSTRINQGFQPNQE